MLHEKQSSGNCQKETIHGVWNRLVLNTHALRILFFLKHTNLYIYIYICRFCGLCKFVCLRKNKILIFFYILKKVSVVKLINPNFNLRTLDNVDTGIKTHYHISSILGIILGEVCFVLGYVPRLSYTAAIMDRRSAIRWWTECGSDWLNLPNSKTVKGWNQEVFTAAIFILLIILSQR